MIPKILKTLDCGKTCGIYLIALGTLSIFSMLFRGISLNRLELDLSPLLFFWAGNYLTKHNNTARKWVMGIALFFVIVVFISAIITPFSGADYVKINLPFYHEQKPSLAMAYFALLAGLILALIPIVLLYSDKAREEFKIGDPHEKA